MGRIYRVGTVIVTALAAVASAVAAPQETGVMVLPTCARSCMTTFFGSTGCSVTDLKCQCESADILGAAYCCFVTNCSAADRRTSNNYIGQLCATVDVEMPQVKCGIVESDDATGSEGTSRTSTASATESAGSTRSASGITTLTRSGDGSSTTGGIIIPAEDSSNPDNANTSNNSGGGGNALPIGLGVGLGVGIPITLGVIGYLAFLFWKTKKGITNGKTSGQDQERLNGNADQAVVAVPREKPELPADPVRPRHELEGDRRFPGELPG